MVCICNLYDWVNIMLLNLLYSPSESASIVNFQAFSLAGIVWWNSDRHNAAV